MKILHIITGLNVGGAEKVLQSLLMSQTKELSVVISLTSLGTIGQQLVDNGYSVFALNLKPYNVLFILFKLFKLIRHHEPDILQTWLYHADLLGGLAAKFAGIRHIVWGIRTTELRKGSFTTSFIRKILAYCSYWVPAKIVVVAERAKEKHAHLGYDISKMLVIHNGFNLNSVNVSAELPVDLKRIASIKDNEIIIGCVGRSCQVKGQDVFIKAAGLVLQKFPKVRFIMVGRGLEYKNDQIISQIEINASLDNFILLSERSDVDMCLRVMDVFCLPSRSEGFPNSLGEAMLLGVPCVSTDAGDAALLGGEDVPIARVDDPEDLADKLISMINMSHQKRHQIGQRLRQRIIDFFSLEIMIGHYQALYEDIRSED